MTVILTEPFNNLTAWTNTTGFSIVAGGVAGTCAQVTGGATLFLTYTIGSTLETADISLDFWWQCSNLSANRTIAQLLSDAAVTQHITLVTNITTNCLQINRGGSGGGALASSAANSMTAINTWHHIELYVRLGDAPNGLLIAKLNGTEFANLTGIDTKNAGTKTTFDSIKLYGPSTSITAKFDELVLSQGNKFAGTATKVWNGTAFVDAPVKVYNGSAFVDAVAVKSWNGTAWVP